MSEKKSFHPLLLRLLFLYLLMFNSNLYNMKHSNLTFETLSAVFFGSLIFAAFGFIVLSLFNLI